MLQMATKCASASKLLWERMLWVLCLPKDTADYSIIFRNVLWNQWCALKYRRGPIDQELWNAIHLLFSTLSTQKNVFEYCDWWWDYTFFVCSMNGIRVKCSFSKLLWPLPWGGTSKWKHTSKNIYSARKMSDTLFNQSLFELNTKHMLQYISM